MSKNILKLCFTALLCVSSFTALAQQHYNLPSEAEVLDYWREMIRISPRTYIGLPDIYPKNEAAVRLLYVNAVNSDPDSLFVLGYLINEYTPYKGVYFMLQAAEQGSELASNQILEDGFLANLVKWGENNRITANKIWLNMQLSGDQELINAGKGRFSSESVEVACQYFIPDPEGYLGPTYYSENKRELSQLDTGRHGCEPYDRNIRDYAKARHYFLRVVDFSLPNNNASERDIYRATQALGVIYRDGLGVPVDKTTAVFYFMATREAE